MAIFWTSKAPRLQHDPSLAAAHRPGRHYGLDWLRIGAFALLIFYHIAMVFAPWDWVIKTDHRIAALIPPMALLTPWRLSLLFAVSGYASARLFQRSDGAGDFARSRAVRLLVPLAFGMIVLVPLEMWVRVMEHGYAEGYLRFWTRDYWRTGSFYGTVFPSWEHLWFVAYLATYTLLLAAVLAWRGPSVMGAIGRASEWASHGYRLLWAPAAGMILLKLALLFVVPEGQGLLTDWGGHAHYAPIFLFGFAAAGEPRLWPAMARLWRRALAVAAACGAIVVTVELAYPGSAIPPHGWMAAERAAAVAMGWAMVLALFHVADRWWNRDHRWRRPLCEAVFPAYLVHHPAIVLAAWYTLPLGLSPVVEFAVLTGCTVAACTLVYLLGRRVGWLRPLIGLASKPRTIAPTAAHDRAARQRDGEVAAAVGLDAAHRGAADQPAAMDANEAGPELLGQGSERGTV